MLKTFLLFLALAGCGPASGGGIGLRFEASPNEFVSCGDVELSRRIISVSGHALVIDVCPDYAECDEAAARTIELEGGALPDLRAIVDPAKHRLLLRMTAACGWEVAVMTADTPARVVFFTANGTMKPKIAPLSVEALANGAMRVTVEKTRLRVEKGKSAGAAGWRVHNADGRGWWLVRE